MKILNIFFLILIIICACSANYNIKRDEIEKVIVYHYYNYDEPGLGEPEKSLFYYEDDIFDISLKYLSPSMYKSIIPDFLENSGLKVDSFQPNSSLYYAFVAYRKNGNNDTLFATLAMEQWCVIKNKNKFYYRDDKQNVLKTLLSSYKYKYFRNEPHPDSIDVK